MRKLCHILLVFLFFCFPCSIEAKKKNKVSIPEIKGWEFEEQVFSDSSINNIDVLETDDGNYRAYYMKDGQILSAVSIDNGKTFSLEDGMRVRGQHHALVKLDNGSIRIYYSKTDDKNLFSAISEDGLNFTEEDGYRLELGAEGDPDSAAIIHPSIIKTPEGGFKIYYDALNNDGVFPNDSTGIMSASSEDGLNFTKDEGLRIKANAKSLNFAFLVWSPFVEYEDGLYKLYFSVESENRKKLGAFIATSGDGISFQIRKKPILRRDSRLGPDQAGQGGLPGLPQDVFIISVDGGKRLFYWSAGNHGTYSAFNDLSLD